MSMSISFSNATAKVVNTKDIIKVLDFFRYKVGTTLDAMLATGVLRNSITWYVAQLEDLGLLHAVCVKPDTHTGFKAKYYSAAPSKWVKKQPRQLSLFTDGDEAVKTALGKEPQLIGDIIKNEWMPDFLKRVMGKEAGNG